LGVTSVIPTIDDIYIIGGYDTTNSHEIIKMNASSQTYERYNIDNLTMYPESRWFHAPSSVWVEKLNRMYFFGGAHVYIWVINYVDEIWYIDLE